MKNKRFVYLDILRIVAIFLVIFNHIAGYYLYMYEESIINTWFYMTLTMITRINVPIFFMISGSLLLEKEESIISILKKRVSRIILVIIIFSAELYLINGYHENYGIIDFFVKVLAGKIHYSYWYLYAYLGFLLMLPYLRKIADSLEKKDFAYFLSLHFIMCTIIPIIDYLFLNNYGFSFTNKFKLPLMAEKAIFYPLIGYYLDKKVDIKNLKKDNIIFLLLMASLGITISNAFTFYQGVKVGFTQDFVELFDYVTTIFVFIFIKYLFVKKGFLKNNQKLTNIISEIGILTFGMYLLDPCLREILYKPFLMLLSPIYGELIVSFMWCLFSMTICGFVTYILKKFTFFSKLI